MVAGGALWAVGLAALDVAYRGIVAAPGSVPFVSAWALGGASMRSVGWYLLTIGVPMVFPDGHLAGPRWHWLPWMLVVVVTGSVIDILTAPGANLTQLGAWRNPTALPAALQPINALAFWASVPLGLVALVAVVVQLVGRWRRGGLLQRQQLTLFAVAAALPILAIPVTFATGVGWLFSAAALPLPFAIGFAVLARGLYDIGPLLTRTWSTGCSPPCWVAPTPGSCWGLGSCWAAEGRVWPWRARRWRSPRRSSPPAAASSRPWTGASTAAATTRRGSSRRSPPACVTRSTWTPSRLSCWPWSTRPCSQPGCGCGCDLPPQGPSDRPDRHPSRGTGGAAVGS
jgi:hypothetical protein